MNDGNDQTAPCVDFDDNDDDGDDSDSEHQSNYYTHTVEAMKTKTGLDVGYKVIWPKRNSCIPSQQSSCCGIDQNIILHPGNQPVVTVNPIIPQSDGHATDSDDNDNENVILELSTQLPSDCIAPMFHGTQWAGTTIWRSAVVALQYLLYYNDCDRNENSCNDLQVTTSAKSNGNGIQLDPTMTLLELGCGLGVPGMVLHAMTGCRTILTDKNDLVSQLQRNIALNFYNGANDGNRHDIDPSDPNFSTERRIEAHALDWSMDGVHELLERCQNTSSSSSSSIHFVLACDCIYEPLYGDSWRNLLNVQNELLRLYPQAYVLTACHRRPSDGIDAYLAEAMQQPYLSHTEQLHIPFAHSSVVELYRLHGKV